jgi:hypothetical protein
VQIQTSNPIVSRGTGCLPLGRRPCLRPWVPGFQCPVGEDSAGFSGLRGVHIRIIFQGCFVLVRGNSLGWHRGSGSTQAGRQAGGCPCWDWQSSATGVRSLVRLLGCSLAFAAFPQQRNQGEGSGEIAECLTGCLSVTLAGSGDRASSRPKIPHEDFDAKALTRRSKGANPYCGLDHCSSDRSRVSVVASRPHSTSRAAVPLAVFLLSSPLCLLLSPRKRGCMR